MMSLDYQLLRVDIHHSCDILRLWCHLIYMVTTPLECDQHHSAYDDYDGHTVALTS